jgi:hypothetical protein
MVMVVDIFVMNPVNVLVTVLWNGEYDRYFIIYSTDAYRSIGPTSTTNSPDSAVKCTIGNDL